MATSRKPQRQSVSSDWRRELELITGKGPKDLRGKLKELQKEDSIRKTVVFKKKIIFSVSTSELCPKEITF
jgi:hypothetical protein